MGHEDWDVGSMDVKGPMEGSFVGLESACLRECGL